MDMPPKNFKGIVSPRKVCKIFACFSRELSKHTLKKPWNRLNSIIYPAAKPKQVESALVIEKKRFDIRKEIEKEQMEFSLMMVRNHKNVNATLTNTL